MTARFAALLLLALMLGPACAQNLPRDHAVYDLAATRDLLLGQTTIYASYTNNSPVTQPAPKVTFALYDNNGQEVGRLVEHADADLAPGQTWHIRASTPLTFARYLPVGAPLPPPPPVVRTRIRRKPIHKAVVHAKPVAKPAPKKTYVYRKPELYDWSKHRSPVPPTHTRAPVRPAAHPAPHPVAHPARPASPAAPASAAQTAPAQPSAASPAAK